MAIAKRVLDKAIASGAPITVQIGGDTFAMIVTSYDRRMVDGSYEYRGKWTECTFHRSDVEIPPR